MKEEEEEVVSLLHTHTNHQDETLTSEKQTVVVKFGPGEDDYQTEG